MNIISTHTLKFSVTTDEVGLPPAVAIIVTRGAAKHDVRASLSSAPLPDGQDPAHRTAIIDLSCEDKGALQVAATNIASALTLIGAKVDFS